MEKKPNSPFLIRKTYKGRDDFDKYYLDVTEKEVFKATGEVDPETGEQLGVVEKKLVIKKRDIQEYLEAQRDTVGVNSYIRSLALQGDDISTFSTSVDEKVDDFSQFPDTLAGVLQAGDRAKALFNSLDPELKGNHTTLEGFLGSLSKETVDKYIEARVASLIPAAQVEQKKEGE